jgi:hypothetical protein
VTVAGGHDSAHVQEMKDQAALTGSGAILDTPTAGGEGGKE